MRYTLTAHYFSGQSRHNLTCPLGSEGVSKIVCIRTNQIPR